MHLKRFVGKIKLSYLDFYISKTDCQRVKTGDSGLQDGTCNGKSGVWFLARSMFLTKGIITCVNPGEGIVLLIFPLSPNTKRV